MSNSTTAPSSSGGALHVTETLNDRKKSRELAEARASGAMAPEVDVKTGSMINPHNPEFITKRPWYLGGGDEGPSLDHQADQRADSERLELSLGSADLLVAEERRKLMAAKRAGKFKVGMWVEAKKKNKKPYLICQIIRIAKKGTVFDVRYDDKDQTVERDIKMKKEHRGRPGARIRMTKTGARSFQINHDVFGKETFDSKRDAYHGYDASHDSHMKQMQEKFVQRDNVRKQAKLKEEAKEQSERKKQNKDNNAGSDSDSDYDSDDGSDSDDEFVQRDEDAKVHTSRLARQGGVGGQQMKVTARNLRIREDTAKYLRNLDPNSAYYDPKSRSMRDNPNPELDPSEVQFAGDNFARISGDAVGLAQTQVFSWDAANKIGTGSGGKDGADGGGENGGASSIIHPQANPSQAELLKKKFTNEASDLKTRQKKAVLDKYGGAEYLDGEGGLATATKSIADANTSSAMEAKKEMEQEKRKARFGVSVVEEHYTRDGKLPKNSKQQAILQNQKSKYEEDIFLNGHTTVWGSFFHKGAFRWGYADDHSLMKHSYCTGANGKIANDEANEMKYGTGAAGSAELARAREMLKAIPQGGQGGNSAQASIRADSKLYGEADQFAKLDENKLKAAIQKQKENEKNTAMDDRKRKYNSMTGDSNDVTEEEMEAYRLSKGRSDDPLAKLAASGEILDYAE